MVEAVSPLIQKILAADDAELLRTAAQGLLPLPPEELIPLQVSLTASADAEVANAASESLRSMEPRIVANYLTSHANDEILGYFVAAVRHPIVVEAILRRRTIPLRFLIELAPELLEDQQEVLLLRQDAIVKEPAILEALERNPRLSRYSARRIREYREHLLPREPEAPPQEPEAGVEEEASEAEVAQALAMAKQRQSGGERDDQTGLSEAQIRSLAVPVRLRLASGASRTLRGILVRDPNPQVAVAVLRRSMVTEQEVELICHNRSISEDVLEEISRRREWIRKPTIMYALVQNPRTPTGIAVRFVSRLSVRELRELSKNRNVPDAVRSTADRLYKIKRR